jgi:hypothetical protein
MSNHHHVVLHINMAEAQSLTDLEVCERWHKLYKGTLLTQKFAKSEPLDEAQWLAVKESWINGGLNWPISAAGCGP